MLVNAFATSFSRQLLSHGLFQNYTVVVLRLENPEMWKVHHGSRNFLKIQEPAPKFSDATDMKLFPC
jgi:hypothetical protein